MHLFKGRAPKSYRSLLGQDLFYLRTDLDGNILVFKRFSTLSSSRSTICRGILIEVLEDDDLIDPIKKFELEMIFQYFIDLIVHFSVSDPPVFASSSLLAKTDGKLLDDLVA